LSPVAPSTGDTYLNTKPRGQFCLVTITVKNVSDEPTTFDGDNQTLINKNGKSSRLTPRRGSDSNTFLEEINPGNS
jgi:Domain of unknown function (DUF4352)